MKKIKNPLIVFIIFAFIVLVMYRNASAGAKFLRENKRGAELIILESERFGIDVIDYSIPIINKFSYKRVGSEGFYSFYVVFDYENSSNKRKKVTYELRGNTWYLSKVE